jgi:hypothetical protein
MICVNACQPGPGAPRDLEAMVPTLVQALKDAKDHHCDSLCGDPDCTCPPLTRGNPLKPVAPPCRERAESGPSPPEHEPGTRTGAAAVHTRHGTHEPPPD